MGSELLGFRGNFMFIFLSGAFLEAAGNVTETRQLAKNFALIPTKYALIGMPRRVVGQRLRQAVHNVVADSTWPPPIYTYN